MAVTDRNMDKNAIANEKVIMVPIVTANDLTSAVVASLLLGYKYQIVRVRTFCRTKAGAVAGVLKVGSRSAATLTFTAATEVGITPSTTLANKRGSSTEALTVEITTDGTGALTNGYVAVTLRPYPLQGEAATGSSKAR